MHPPRAAADIKMSLFEHLTELRTRLLRVFIAVVVLGLLSLIFARELYGLLMRPVLLALPRDAASLIYTSAIEEINVFMKIGLYAGIFLSMPILLWQLWAFVAPGLYLNERRLLRPFVFFGTFAFLTGTVFCYFVLLPQVFTFLLGEKNKPQTQRLAALSLHRDDVLRHVRLGQPTLASAKAMEIIHTLNSESMTEGLRGTSAGVPTQHLAVRQKLQKLGHLIDAIHMAFGQTAGAGLTPAIERRKTAVQAFSEGRFVKATQSMEESIQRIQEAFPQWKEPIATVWHLEKLFSQLKARQLATKWTRPMLSMREQLSLVLLLELAFGLIFELPLVMLVLGMMGVISSKSLCQYQRHAFVVCLILAAVITPTGDAINLALMAGPMVLCFEVGVFLVWLTERQRAANTPPKSIES